MDVNIDDDDSEEFFRNLFAQLESLSLSDATVVDETTDPWNSNHLLQPLPSKKQAPQDQSVVRIGSNKRIIAVDPTQQLDQCYIAETSQSINLTLQSQTGRSSSQVLFTVPPVSFQFKPVGSSVDTCAADSNQQQPRKRQRR